MDRMDFNTFVYLSLVCMWFSLHVGRSPLIVTVQPMLSAVAILTPEADRKEGGEVRMQCTTYFDSRYFTLEWRKDNIIFKEDEGTVTSDPGDSRFSFFQEYDKYTSYVYDETLIITGVHRDDSGIYTCNIIDKRGASGVNTVASLHVVLSVLYFPSKPFPICSPAGPVTTVAGTELNIQCSSEVGNPQVMMEIVQNKYNNYTFTLSHRGDMISMSLALIVDIDYNGVLFLCTITSPVYYPEMSRSCFIGPINVSMIEESPTTLTTEPPTNLPTTSKTYSVPLLPGLVAATVLLAVSVIINVLLIIMVLRLRRLNNSVTDGKGSEEPAAEPYMELQSTSKNTVYMDPVVIGAEDAAEQHTCSQADEAAPAATDQPTYRQEDTNNTVYEDVNAKGRERPYQNIIG